MRRNLKPKKPCPLLQKRRKIKSITILKTADIPTRAELWTLSLAHWLQHYFFIYLLTCRRWKVPQGFFQEYVSSVRKRCSSPLLLVPAPANLWSLLQTSVNILSRGFCCSIHPFAIHLSILHMLISKCKPMDL